MFFREFFIYGLSAEMNDNVVIQEILNGDVDKFRILLDRYETPVKKIISGRIPHQEYDSILQDIFLKAFQGLSRFDTSKPFENWISRIAVRSCCDYWRNKSREKSVDLSSLAEEHNQWIERVSLLNSIEEFEKSVTREETYEILQIILAELAEEDRMLMELVYLDGWKLKDVAKLYNWKESKIKVRAMRARDKLRKIIEKFL